MSAPVDFEILREKIARRHVLKRLLSQDRENRDQSIDSRMRDDEYHGLNAELGLYTEALVKRIDALEAERDALRKAARSFLRNYDYPVGSFDGWEKNGTPIEAHYRRLTKLVGHGEQQSTSSKERGT